MRRRWGIGAQRSPPALMPVPSAPPPLLQAHSRMVNLGFPPLMNDPSDPAPSNPAINPAPTSGLGSVSRQDAGIREVGWARAQVGAALGAAAAGLWVLPAPDPQPSSGPQLPGGGISLTLLTVPPLHTTLRSAD